MDVAYLFAAGLGAIIWLTLYLLRPDLRRVMLYMSAVGIPMAFSDLFYVPQYWKPRTLGGVPVGIEGLLFSFEAAGICAVIYPAIFKRQFSTIAGLGAGGRLAPMPRDSTRPGHRAPGTRRVESSPHPVPGARPHWRKLIPIVLPLPVSVVVAAGLHTNIEWGLYLGLVVAAAATISMRPDLARAQVLGGMAFTPVYTLALVIWAAAYPEVHGWFTLWRMPHWYFLNVPLTEIVFGGLFAAYWTGLYPMVFDKTFSPRTDRRPQFRPTRVGYDERLSAASRDVRSGSARAEQHLVDRPSSSDLE